MLSRVPDGFPVAAPNRFVRLVEQAVDPLLDALASHHHTPSGRRLARHLRAINLEQLTGWPQVEKTGEPPPQKGVASSIATQIIDSTAPKGNPCILGEGPDANALLGYPP